MLVIADFIRNYYIRGKIAFLTSLFKPVYWCQDINFINDGYEYACFSDENAYEYGTYFQWKNHFR